jgi:hypothetical protein
MKMKLNTAVIAALHTAFALNGRSNPVTMAWLRKGSEMAEAALDRGKTQARRHQQAIRATFESFADVGFAACTN